MRRFVLHVTAALILIIGNAAAQTDEQKKPVQAKEPTVVTVHGKRGEVAEDKSALKNGEKEPNAAKRLVTKIGKGLGRVWHGTVDLTESALGLDDVTEKGRSGEGEAAK